MIPFFARQMCLDSGNFVPGDPAKPLHKCDFSQVEINVANFNVFNGILISGPRFSASRSKAKVSVKLSSILQLP